MTEEKQKAYREMRSLTVCQPWATLLVLGVKPVENRNWQTDYRGPVAIIAGRKLDIGERAAKALADYLPAITLDALPRGVCIGVVDIFDVTRSMDSWWFTGPWGMLVRNPFKLGWQIPARGHQSIRKCDPELRELIMAQI